jgi:hypothetical protein
MDSAFGWLFIVDKPLLFEKNRVAKQLKIEAWLDLAEVLKELGIEKPAESKISLRPADYVV